MKKMRNNYVKPDFSFLEMELESRILEGSLTSAPIKLQSVVVEDYSNGFSSNEFPGGFKDITFD